MYRILLCLLVLLAPAAQAAVVGNAAADPSSEDSLSVALLSLDSLGNPTSADSIFLAVIGPHGAAAFVDSFSVSDPRVITTSLNGRPYYVLNSAVADIDGTGAPGAYAICAAAKNTATGLITPTAAGFQVVGVGLAGRLALLDDTVVVSGGVVDTNRTERGLSQGSGLHSVTLIARDTASDAVIPYSRITLRNIDRTATLGLGVTDVSGAAVFQVDSDSIVVLAAVSGYTFAPETLLVNGPLIDTLPGDPLTLDPPPSPDLCRVWGYLFGIDAAPLEGAAVRASLPDGVVRYTGAIISPAAVETTTDSTGRFRLDLLPSAHLNPPDTKYEVTITRTDGAVLRQRLLVPDQSLWELTW